jgi:2-polyprenyl-6-methoxyphenol hydroxylase-like FAD-dependent oxidoreductase
MEQRFQVIIVGGGPVGVALAVELGQRGVECAVVERHLTPQQIPKGQNLTQRTLEHFYFWNCVDELRAARLLPPGYPIGGVTAYGNLMGEYWYSPKGREVVHSYYFQENDRLPQYLTEEVLRRRLESLPSVTCLFGRSAKSVEQNDKGVRVLVADEGWPYEEQVLAADYVVGCDGARSLVRDILGIDRGGADFDQRMVLAVFRSKELHEGLKRFPERTTYRVLKPELRGYWQFFGRVDVGEGWFFHAPVPAGTTQQNYDFHGLLQEAAGFQFGCTFDHVGFWDLRIAVADRYRGGRAFIAGDAAHTHPPYGGFGLNSGLEDVANLGWKLAAVLQGWGGDSLLDSYSAERRPIFVETGEAVIAGGIERDRAFLDRYNPALDKAEFEAAWSEMAMGGLGAQSYEPHYEGSPVVMGPPDGTCSIHGSHSFMARAGHHLAPQQLSIGRNVFEELGDCYSLLVFDAGPLSKPFEKAAQALGMPLKVIEDTDEAGRREYAARLILVRPDQYVVWAGDSPPNDAGALLRRVAGIA